MTREQAKELVKYFFMTFSYQRNYHAQPTTLGGRLLNGETAVNELSYIMLEAYDECNIISPKLHIMVAENTPDEFLKKCLDMTRRGRNSMVFLNEDLFRRIWAKHYDAKDLETHRLGTSGCYNLTLDNVHNTPFHTRINLPKILENIFDDETTLAGLTTFEKFFAACVDRIKKITDDCVLISDYYDSIADKVNPSNLYSGGSKSALKKAEDMFTLGSKYNDTAIIASCPSTVFDSLAIVKKYVFDNEVLSLNELKEALAADWKGYESLQQTIIADREKWGNSIEF